MATTKPTTYVIGSNGKAVIEKDPDATLDYSFDWAAWLAAVGDSIASVEFLVDPSLTIENVSHDATTATAWLSGGVAPATGANTLRVTCRITTTNTPPRIDDRSVFLKIVER